GGIVVLIQERVAVRQALLRIGVDDHGVILVVVRHRHDLDRREELHLGRHPQLRALRGLGLLVRHGLLVTGRRGHEQRAQGPDEGGRYTPTRGRRGGDGGAGGAARDVMVTLHARAVTATAPTIAARQIFAPAASTGPRA